MQEDKPNLFDDYFTAEFPVFLEVVVIVRVVHNGLELSTIAEMPCYDTSS